MEKLAADRPRANRQLSVRGREDTFRALEQLDMPWHQIVDAKKIPDSLYQVRYIPHIILFAPDGTIIKRGLRGEQIYTTIQQLLEDE